MLQLDFQTQLDDFTLDAQLELPHPGMIGVYGPNGSGKSSLLMGIAGLADTKGTIQFQERVWCNTKAKIHVAPHERSACLLFQDQRLFPHLSVGKNLQYAANRARKTGSSVTQENVVDAVEIRALLNRMPEDLSGGERQRVALARAILCQADLLLLDEPLSAVDTATRSKIWHYLNQLCVETNTTIIAVSHELEELVEHTDSIVSMQSGRIVSTSNIIQNSHDIGTIIDTVVGTYDEELMMQQLKLAHQELYIPAVTPRNEGAKLRAFVNARDVAIATTPPKQLSIRNHLLCVISSITQDPSSPYVNVTLQIAEPSQPSSQQPSSQQRASQTVDQLVVAQITRASAVELNLAVGESVYALVKSVTFGRR